MSLPVQPRLRVVESFPVSQANGEVVFTLRDPQGFATPIAIPYQAALLASLMDGRRTLAEIQEDFGRIVGQPLASEDLEDLVTELDHRLFLDTDRFRVHWKSTIEQYLNNPVRPAAHAGSAYAADPAELRKQLEGLFTGPRGPGVPDETRKIAAPAGEQLRGVLSPHIDVARGGTAFAFAYKKLVEESDADVFVIFGTAHTPLRNLFSISRKHFETPLGTVHTDIKFINRLRAKFEASPQGKKLNLFADELAHRHEHSIEFQTVFLQYLLGERRKFQIVPILVGSFHEFIQQGTQPSESPAVQAFASAIRATAAETPGGVFYISSGDLAHLGPRFGDRFLLDRPRLERQSADDQQLLTTAARCDRAAFFNHVAAEKDRARICGLSPTYTMLEALQPRRGELLKYGQAVERDATSCVSFASMAFYGG